MVRQVSTHEEPSPIGQNEFNVALIYACQIGDVEKINVFLEVIQFTNSIRNTALIAAIVNNELDVVKVLIEGDDNGIPYADIHHNDNYPLRAASLKGYIDIIKYLVKKGARSYKAVLWACDNGQLAVVKLLIGKYKFHKNENLNVAIIKAEEHGFVQIVKYLKSRKSLWKRIIYSIKN